ncbi:MAG TPA: PEP-CTERM sorting domain-containing protein [Anaerohalosphaeraceae bacterium]|nr:PEP-CTERM sorting domain-containing protein [Anaerohalosphaeraceae bacterium]
MRAGGYSDITISGGEIRRLTIGTYATAQISGGQIDQIWSSYFLPDANRIILTCNSGYLLSYTNGVVTGISGTWRDGSDFNIQLVNPAGSSTVFSNMTIIPEPATMLLLAVGGMLIRRK